MAAAGPATPPPMTSARGMTTPVYDSWVRSQRLSLIESLYMRENSTMTGASSTTARRDALIEHVGNTMQVFMARAVLFQDAVAKRAGLNSTDLQLTSLLMLFGPATPGELAERSGLTAGGAITAAIDRLEQAGIVVRSRDAHDRRRVIVTVNLEMVLAKVGAVYGAVGQRWADYLNSLTDEQIAFADELFSRAAEFNHEETMRLRGPASQGG
jgi:MarR family